MSIVENPASQAHGHTWRQEEVKGEPGHPVAALLPGHDRSGDRHGQPAHQPHQLAQYQT